jgi:hypothetical protein
MNSLFEYNLLFLVFKDLIKTRCNFGSVEKYDLVNVRFSGDHGSTVVKELRYKSKGRWFDPS